MPRGRVLFPSDAYSCKVSGKVIARKVLAGQSAEGSSKTQIPFKVIADGVCFQNGSGRQPVLSGHGTVKLKLRPCYFNLEMNSSPVRDIYVVNRITELMVLTALKMKYPSSLFVP